MFVRKNSNRSGSVSIQIISKRDGQYKVVETVGTSKDPDEVEKLVLEAKNRIYYPGNQPNLFPILSEADLAIKNFVDHITNLQIHTVGPELILGKLFDEMGFNVISEQMFRHIVLARLAYPSSKLKTVDYLWRSCGIKVEVDSIYRFLDRLSKTHKAKVEQIAYEHTQHVLKSISVVFYDMTTLYFETEDEDDIRKIGFSKDGKFQKPQIMLGLLVGQNGYPIGYDIFEGNTFEGHTLLPILENIQKKYGFGKPIVVADAALLSRKNLETLAREKYKFIIGGRIKNESDEVKQQILRNSKGMGDNMSFIIEKTDKTRLVVTYSDLRQRKDAYNRDRGLKKLRLQIKSGKLTKENINNRGYNKFLKLEGQLDVAIDEKKIEEDKLWDGLKGYITNTELEPEKIVENYKHLWQIEKAFRISKTDLRIRPIYHFKKKRIAAHICISFVAYAIYKELERLLEENHVGLSSKRAIELTHTMYQLEYTLPHSKKQERTTLKMDHAQQLLYDCICKNRSSKTPL